MKFSENSLTHEQIKGDIYEELSILDIKNSLDTVYLDTLKSLTNQQLASVIEKNYKNTDGTYKSWKNFKKDHGWAFIVQLSLTRLGYNPGGIDGRYGKNTRDEVRGFQKKHGFSKDGLAGPKTLEKMASLLQDLSTQEQIAESIVAGTISNKRQYYDQEIDEREEKEKNSESIKPPHKIEYGGGEFAGGGAGVER